MYIGVVVYEVNGVTGGDGLCNVKGDDVVMYEL